MKLFPLTLLSFVATATAFTPHGAAQSTCRSTSALKMVPDEFAQSEIDSNDVRANNDLRNLSQYFTSY
jgi:exonuclease VII large subunit